MRFLAQLAVVFLLTASAKADDGPVIELAPEHAKKPPIALGAGPPSDAELASANGMTERRFHAAEESASSTSIGGYGEIAVNGAQRGDTPREWTADLGRLVLFVAHPFDERFRFYAELEVEHAKACADCKGEIAFEQAFLDWRIAGERLVARAGVVILPVGILNQAHEPPSFHGVFRPSTETLIIPTTWRELGIGLFSRPIEPVRLQLYMTTAPDVARIGADGFGEASAEGSLARANAVAFVGRAEVEPILGLQLGASGFASDAGGNASAFDATGHRLSLRAPVFGADVDVRFHRAGIEAKALFTEWRFPHAGDRMSALDASGKPLADPSSPVPEAMRGGYVEVAYDVLRPFAVKPQLLPFVRIEAYDTQAAVPSGFTSNPAYQVHEQTFGLSLRPIPQIIVKTDYQTRQRRSGAHETAIDLGLGFIY